MNKANKINPIDIIFVRIFIYTKVMKKFYPRQVTGYKLQVGKIQLATCKLVTLLIQDFFALETYRV